jgi:hypothetical protein
MHAHQQVIFSFEVLLYTKEEKKEELRCSGWEIDSNDL